ncbi:phage tail protein [Mycetohabitans rhizoxinica]|jgi:phage tail-like protein|uniref:Phage tail protein n=3 Tax=Mycetohabitans TaxID=2571159 RepID=E5AT12_MYCRK|nr:MULTISPECIES: phage tail protein [Mycetohabitans]MCF7697015.1 phage tail protein [Mycetohabitans sp. B2]MCG1045924.1 phage tail protein [Mycetohabitans sp. B6]QGY72857.1 hypothetical protein [Mycetohabitans sp.]CBW73556.1 unnamed protein product [Mycetohabitans rhizoxinica HKI 454]
MATTADQIATDYPIPVYRFKVTLGKDEMAFSNVSGLDLGFETITYKDGAGHVYRMPGQSSELNITLRRGVIKGKNELYDWISKISKNLIDKRDLSISLTDEAGTALLVTWNVTNAFPSKLSGPSFDATSNEVSIEELTLVADRLTMTFH